MHGKVVGLSVSLEEVVTERNPGARKVWETVATRLLVIGRYRLGFELVPRGASSSLCVFIDYDLPKSGPARWLGRLLGGAYAWWCVKRMVAGARRLTIDLPQAVPLDP
jgi:hypothetical protein